MKAEIASLLQSPFRRLLTVLLAALVASSCMATSRSANISPGNLDGNPTRMGIAHTALRSLDDDTFYDPVDQPIAFGFEWTDSFPGVDSSNFGYEGAVAFAFDFDEVGVADVSSSFVEGNIGVRGSVDIERLRLFAGGGLAIILADIDVTVAMVTATDNDIGFGPYVHAGAMYFFGSNWSLGFDVRFLTATDLDIGGASTDADYVQGGIVVGFGL